MTSNPFEDLSLPAPVVPAHTAESIAATVFGVVGDARPLGSNQEANLLLRAGDRRVVLKIANPAFTHAELDLQNAAMLHVAPALAAVGVTVPTPLPSRSGSLIDTVELDGRPHHVRLLTFVPGKMLADTGYLADQVLQQVGATAAAVGAALRDFDHRSAERVLQWDPRRAADVVAALLPSVGDPTHRTRLEAVVEVAFPALEPLVAHLRTQVVHGDLADYNLVSDTGPDGRPRVTGIIDFGDVMRSWLVGELTTAATTVLTRSGRNPVLDVADVIAGAHAVTPLTEAEITAVWPLVLARAAVLAVSVEHQLSEDPDNAYAQAERDLDWRILQRVADVPVVLAEEVLRSRLGLPPGATAQAAADWVASTPMHPIAPRAVAALGSSVDLDVADLSVTSLDVQPDDDGRGWTARPPTVPTVTRYGEARLTHTVIDSRDEPLTIHLDVELLGLAGAPVVAPVAGRLRLDDGTVAITTPAATVLLRGVTPGAAVQDDAEVAAGDVLGDATAALGVHVAAAGAGNPSAVPTCVSESLAPAWRRVCPDPSALVGLRARVDVDAESAATLLTRRTSRLATVQEHYYRSPPRIERGWRTHLLDTSARAYLDMVNNVAVLGHSHPAVTAAATRQLRLLNTNSRFLYGAMVELAERVVATLPPPLDTVFLVSSGSEAVDLALRIARAATGARDVLCLRGGYHGWTTATDEISTSLQDNPNAPGTRPPWVHVVPMPNIYRGEHRDLPWGAPAATAYADAVRAVVEGLVTAGHRPAAFVAEPLSGNAGGVELPPDYLAQAYASVRAAGGLCVSDEVQVGYGRLGKGFWGFAEHGVLPDIVTMAKAAGNGHPLGFVVTRRELAESFGTQGSFFSSVGGSPVSSAVGLAVLDVVQTEQLQHNAARVGGHLQARLQQLVGTAPLVGHIHGHGLYQGVELVTDLDTRTPATAQAAAICERLLRLGVICQPTGDHMNVLKVKPPLCIREGSADFFVDVLADVLHSGW